MSLTSAFTITMLSREQQVFLWMTAVFLTCLLVANLTGSFLFAFNLSAWLPLGLAGMPVLLSAGIIAFPVTFILTDLLNEFYGEKAARYVTLVGFVMSVLVFGFLWIGQQLPAYPDSPFPKAQYDLFSNLYIGMIAASLAAYVVGQLLDIQLFQLFRKLTKGKYLWLRAQGSTVFSQLFDSLIVSFIAFSGTMESSVIWHLALSNYVWKFVIVLLITPGLYLGHFFLRNLMKDKLRGKEI